LGGTGAGEKLIGLAKASEFINRTRGERVSPSTLHRWIFRGKLGVRLDAVKLNGKGWLTSREALARFAAALSARAAGVQAGLDRQCGGADRERRAKAAMDAMERDRQREREERRRAREMAG
jgi:hypothetical protein